MPTACPKKRPDRHCGAEDAWAEPADIRLGVQLALEKERTPGLDPSLDDERSGAGDPDHEERTRETRSPARARLRVGCLGPCRVSGEGKGRHSDQARDGDRIGSRPTPALRASPAATAPARTPQE